MLVLILKTPYYIEKKAVKESRQSSYLHGLLPSLPSRDILCYYLLQPPDTHCSSDRQLTQLSLMDYKLRCFINAIDNYYGLYDLFRDFYFEGNQGIPFY